MAALAPAMRERLIAQLRGMLDEAERDSPFDGFRCDAENVLSDRSSEPRFPFVILSLWRAFVGEPPGNWRTRLADLYDEFVASYPWSTDQLPPGVDPALLERGLFHTQRKLTVPAKPRHVFRLLSGVRRLAAVGVKP